MQKFNLQSSSAQNLSSTHELAEPGGSPPLVGPSGLLIFLSDLIGNLLSTKYQRQQLADAASNIVQKKQRIYEPRYQCLLSWSVTRTRDSQASKNAEMRSLDAL